jgi:NADH:ubiquinone oxidoreductase subunit
MWVQGLTNRTTADGGAWKTNILTYTLDPSKFNGVVKLEWEIVALNAEAFSQDVDLYQGTTKIATLTVPAGATEYRGSTEISWPSSTKPYVLEIPTGTAFDYLYIFHSRFKIYQENATATSIQICFHGDQQYGGWGFWGGACLFQGGENHPSAAWDVAGYRDADNWVTQSVVAGGEYAKRYHTRWTYHADHWASISAVRLNASMEVWSGAFDDNPATGYLRLYDETAAAQVGSTISLYNSSECPARSQESTSISPSGLQDGHTYVIQGRVTRDDPVGNWGTVLSFHTCVYLDLNEGLEALETYYHLLMGDDNYGNASKQYLDFDDFNPITSVSTWMEAARGSDYPPVEDHGKSWITDDSAVVEYGPLYFPWLGSQTYEIREGEFDYQQLSAGNYHMEANIIGNNRAHRMIIYQNINERVQVDDLNNWNDGVNKTLGP